MYLGFIVFHTFLEDMCHPSQATHTCFKTWNNIPH